MRYDLTDFEWSVIQPLLPNRSRGVKRVDDRRVLNGIFWILRSGAPWRDLPGRYGLHTTCYNRFNRWRKAGVWDQLMDAITEAYDGDVQMIDSSSRPPTCWLRKKGGGVRCMGRSRGGLTTKIHAVVDPQGLPIRLGLTPGQALDNKAVPDLLKSLPENPMVLGDRAYDTDWIRQMIRSQGAWATYCPSQTGHCRSASAHTFTGHAIWWNVSSTRSNTSGASPRDTTNLLQTTWL